MNSSTSVKGGKGTAGRRSGITRRGFVKFGGQVTATTMAATMASSVLAASGVLASALGGCRSAIGDELFLGIRTITDHAGREMQIPTADKLERVYFTSALAQIFVFSLAPELQGGTGLQFTKQELEYLPENTNKLKYMGSLSGGGEIDREMLLAEKIQLVFSVSGQPLTASEIDEAEKLQRMTNIPVVCVDGSFQNIVEAYRFMGDVMGRGQRAQELGVFLERIYGDVTRALAGIKDSERVSLYYAEGPFGLSTEPDISQHALTFEVAKAKNVAAVELSAGIGMTNVSLEAVMKWDPEVIVAWDDVIRGGADEIIRTKREWANIQAVRNGRVYTMPNAPFAWCDRPPGVNRFLGIQWVANMLYPDKYAVDMVQEVKGFYRTMYWREITDDQARQLLGNSYPPYKAR